MSGEHLDFASILESKLPEIGWTVDGDSYEGVHVDGDKPTLEQFEAWADEVALESERSIKKQTLIMVADMAMESISGDYSDKERESWRKQESDARAYDANNEASTPFLDAYVASSGIAKDVAAAAIIAKADAFEVASGNIIGQVVAYRHAIEAATTIEELNAVTLEIV